MAAPLRYTTTRNPIIWLKMDFSQTVPNHKMEIKQMTILQFYHSSSVYLATVNYLMCIYSTRLCESNIINLYLCTDMLKSFVGTLNYEYNIEFAELRKIILFE